VFAINTDGTGFRILHNFAGGSDGANPVGGLILSSNTLFGTTSQTREVGYGTVFSIQTNGSKFTTLYAFSGGGDGSRPYGKLVLEGNVLYGTTAGGGDFGKGVVYAINTDGTGLTTLYSFSGGSDGSLPWCDLLLSGNNTLLGTTPLGGSANEGTAFAISTDGSGFTNLYSFTPTSGPSATNSDGSHPSAGLVSSENTFYGAASMGGSGGEGTLFKVNADGTSFTSLYSFTATSNSTNSDGATPGGYEDAGLTLSGNTLYGTAPNGGSSGNGTAFAVKTDGTGFTVLHSFSGGSGGASPNGGLIFWGNTLYGTTYQNSNAAGSGSGTVFSISLAVNPPQLTITPSESNVILTWPTTGFTLQSTTNLISPVWATNLPAPVIVNGQNTVTNLALGTQQFFRLSQ
jgi:uncharacterized repeat protein (TIGR03803 family)